MASQKQQIEELIKKKLVLTFSESDGEPFAIAHKASDSINRLISSVRVELTGEHSFILWIESVGAIQTITFDFNEPAAASDGSHPMPNLSVNVHDHYGGYHLLEGKRHNNPPQAKFEVGKKAIMNIVVSDCYFNLLDSITLNIDSIRYLSSNETKALLAEQTLEAARQKDSINKNKGIIKQQSAQIKETKQELAKLKSDRSVAEQEFNEMNQRYTKLKNSIKDYPDTLGGYRKHHFILIGLYSIIALFSILALAYIADYFISILKPNEIPDNFGILDAIAFALYKSPATAIALGILAFSAKMIISIYREIVTLNKESLTMTQLNVLAQTAYNSSSNAFAPDSLSHDKAVEAKLSLITKVFTNELTSSARDKNSNKD